MLTHHALTHHAPWYPPEVPRDTEPSVRFPANHVDRPRSVLEALLAYLPTQLVTGIYGRIARGGELCVSTTLLFFTPHGMNLYDEYSLVDIPVRTIVSMRTHQSLLSALLTVTTLDGTEHVFVCWSRRKIIRAVQGLLALYGPIQPAPAYHYPVRPPSPPRADWP